MIQSYAYIEENTVIIGNSYIERRFSTKNNKLITTEIVNKRIQGDKKIVLKGSSAEFYIGFKVKKTFGYKTHFVSSNDLILDNVNVFKHRVEFAFKPYLYSSAKISFVINVEIEDNCHYMHKYIEMLVEPEEQHLITIDYIDCEHMFFENAEQTWTIGNIDKAYLSKYHSALGQPFYINGMFFGSEFPLTENKIYGNLAYIRYYSGKRFDALKLNCGHTFRTWKTVAGASRGLDFDTVREDFLRYIRNISRPVEPRFQYNSWYDHMYDITDENIEKSFKEIEQNLSKTLVPPLDSYVIDDGFVDYKSDFWCFNDKFPNELYPASLLARKLSSDFGLWLGPRGSYCDETPKFGIRMEKAGKGGFNKRSMDVCVSSSEYIKNVTDFFISSMDKFDINYWKLDGFLLKACPSKKHGHMVGGYNDMYQYTEMWENWIDIFRKMRLHRETAGKSLWINQTSYSNVSPWFLQWSDSLWMQNSTDIGRLEKTKKGEFLGGSDADKVLSYRDDRYYDFCITRNYQFPLNYLYNHDPIYGNTAKISMSDEEYRKYMFMMATRGNAFWELYYSYNMFSEEKWRINSDALRFIRNNYHILKNARFIGGSPAEGKVYGYSSWKGGQGIVSLRNPANREQKYTLTLDKTVGIYENVENLFRAIIYPYSSKVGEETYNYGDIIDIILPPHSAVIMKFSSVSEPRSNLIYGRFNSSRELLLFFDDRIYFDEKSVSSDSKIESVNLLEDYSTLKITFENDVTSAFVSLSVSNVFGDISEAEYSGKYYSDFLCDSNNIPSGRDFTIDLTLDSVENGKIFDCSNVLGACVLNDMIALNYADKTCVTDVSAKKDMNLKVISEPNGLVKLFVNGNLECSIYNGYYFSVLENSPLTLSSNVKDVKIFARAL